ncbi:MAG: DNA double-strand break repair nuclease NurA [Thermoplasmata archaeon]
MVEDAITRVMQILNEYYAGELGNPYFGSGDYVPIEFHHENFHKIPKINLEENDIRMVAVDGGNHEIISTPGISVSLIRVSAIGFRGKKREKLQLPGRIEVFCIAKSELESGKIKYCAEYFPASSEECFLRECKIGSENFEGIERVLDFNLRPLSVVSGIARKYAEWFYIERLLNELGDGDVIIKDGVFQYSDDFEAEIGAQVCEKALKKGITVTGLAKTTTLITTTGLPLPLAIQALADKYCIASPWYYFPLVACQNQKSDIYLAKFHENSEYIFRFDVMQNTLRHSVETILGILRGMSANCIFPGYPYNLLLADKMARVEEKECKSLYYRFLSTSKNRRIQIAMRALDAHDIISKY